MSGRSGWHGHGAIMSARAIIAGKLCGGLRCWILALLAAAVFSVPLCADPMTKAVKPLDSKAPMSAVGALDFIRLFAPAASPIALDLVKNQSPPTPTSPPTSLIEKPLENPHPDDSLNNSPDTFAAQSLYLLKRLSHKLESSPRVARAQSLARMMKDHDPLANLTSTSLTFLPAPALCGRDGSCSEYERAYAKQREQARMLTQAKAVLFRAIINQTSKIDEQALYLALARLHMRLGGLYELDTLRAYAGALCGDTQADIASTPRSTPRTRESSMPLSADSSAIDRVLLMLLQRTIDSTARDKGAKQNSASARRLESTPESSLESTPESTFESALEFAPESTPESTRATPESRPPNSKSAESKTLDSGMVDSAWLDSGLLDSASTGGLLIQGYFIAPFASTPTQPSTTTTSTPRAGSTPQRFDAAFVRVASLQGRQCVALIALSAQSHLSAQPYLLCFPHAVDSLALFPFDGELFILAGDTLYRLAHPNEPLQPWAKLRYSNERGVILAAKRSAQSTPARRICEQEIVDSQRDKHALEDLRRAGFVVDSLSNALHSWAQEIAGADTRMQVEYLGHLDVFNNGKPVPLARAYTTIGGGSGDRGEKGDERENGMRFYEAFTLDPATMQADISLSHSSMNLQGRIPALGFVQLGEKILGCVKSVDGSADGGGVSGARGVSVGLGAGFAQSVDEEKLYAFSPSALPELVLHQRFERRIIAVEPIAPESRLDSTLDSARKAAPIRTRSAPQCLPHAFTKAMRESTSAREWALLQLGVEIIDELGACKQLRSAMTACQAPTTSTPATSSTTKSPTASSARPTPMQCVLKAISAQIENML